MNHLANFAEIALLFSLIIAINLIFWLVTFSWRKLRSVKVWIALNWFLVFIYCLANDKISCSETVMLIVAIGALVMAILCVLTRTFEKIKFYKGDTGFEARVIRDNVREQVDEMYNGEN